MTDIFTPEYFEKHITTVVPIVNVDLLIRDKEGRILLSWRDDGMFYGWHVPGRIVRFKESLYNTARECWIHEIRDRIIPRFKFITSFETIKEQDIRGHFITFIASATVSYINFNSDNSELHYVTYNETGPEQHHYEDGFLLWHDGCPEDLIPEQKRYRRYFKS